MRVAVLFGHLYRTVFPVFDCQHGIEEYRGYRVGRGFKLSHSSSKLPTELYFRISSLPSCSFCYPKQSVSNL